MKYKINNEYIVDAKSPKEAIRRIENFKDSKKLKDSLEIRSLSDVSVENIIKNVKQEFSSGKFIKSIKLRRIYDNVNAILFEIYYINDKDSNNFTKTYMELPFFFSHLFFNDPDTNRKKYKDAFDKLKSLEGKIIYDDKSLKDSEKLKDSYIIETIGGTYTMYLQNDNRFGFNKEEAKKLNYNEATSLVNSYKKSNPELKLKIVIDSCKDKNLKDSYFIVACEQGDFWYNEAGKPDLFKNAKKFGSYEEADRWRRNKGSGSVQKVTDSTKNSEKLKDSTIVLRKDESFERQIAEKIAREYNLQLRMDGVKNVFTGSEDDLYKMIYTYFRSNYADRISERIKDSCKDSYYTETEKRDKEFRKNAIEEMERYIRNWDFLSASQKRDIDCSRKELIARVEELRNFKYSCEDSCKDEKIYKVNVKYAEDRDVSKLITEAQNIGFTTDDRGFDIYLKNGNDEMLRKLKIRVYGTGVVFDDSCEDSCKDESVFMYKGYTLRFYSGYNSFVDMKNFYTIHSPSNVLVAAQQDLESAKRYVDERIKKGMKDSEIEYLTQEEEQAVEDYRKAIQNTTNPKLLEIYSHILQEETEHIRELQEAKKIDER